MSRISGISDCFENVAKEFTSAHLPDSCSQTDGTYRVVIVLCLEENALDWIAELVLVNELLNEPIWTTF